MRVYHCVQNLSLNAEESGVVRTPALAGTLHTLMAAVDVRSNSPRKKVRFVSILFPPLFFFLRKCPFCRAKVSIFPCDLLLDLRVYAEHTHPRGQKKKGGARKRVTDSVHTIIGESFTRTTNRLSLATPSSSTRASDRAFENRSWGAVSYIIG